MMMEEGGLRLIRNTVVRHFSRERAVNVRKINPKVAIPEAKSIAQSLWYLIKHHGLLTVSNTWIHAKEANISGLTSKTHIKVMLKWMRGRDMLKLSCTRFGSTKKFMHRTLPEEELQQMQHSKVKGEVNRLSEKPSMKRKKK